MYVNLRSAHTAKIDFRVNPTMRTNKTVCRNCRHYHEATEAQKLQERERELFKRFGSLPYNWHHDPQYQ
jgi:hypothetical protein